MRVLYVSSPTADPRTPANVLDMRLASMVVEIAHDSLEAMAYADTLDFDCIVLVEPLADSTTAQMIRSLRVQKIEAPILVLAPDGCGDAVKSLNEGADDYAGRIHGEEVIARIRALTRRAFGRTQSFVNFGPFRLDCINKTLTHEGRDVHLTGKEYEMLEVLALRRGATITKDMFLSHLYRDVDEPETKIIDVFICKLRKKLSRFSDLEWVETIWGRGYRLAPEVLRTERSGVIANVREEHVFA